MHNWPPQCLPAVATTATEGSTSWRREHDMPEERNTTPAKSEQTKTAAPWYLYL